MDISIIIPSYNSQDCIGSTLENITAQDTSLAYEVIVVDCSETTLVKDKVTEFSNIKYIHCEQRFNPGEGRNIGSQNASGELLIFIDADIKLSVKALQSAWACFTSGRKIFGGALELNAETSNGLSSYLEHYFFNHEAQALRPACERNNLSSALMCFEKKLFVSSGGFRDIPRMQDTELTERLRANGQKLYFCPQVLAYQTQDSPIANVLRKIYINGQNLYYIRYQAEISFIKKCCFFIALPLIGGMKIIRIILRHLRYQSWENKAITLALVLPLTLAILYWVAGFYHALIWEKGIGKSR